jgi:hypothetical protein
MMTAVVFPAMLLMLRFSLNGGTKREEMDDENGMSRFELRLCTMLQMEEWKAGQRRELAFLSPSQPPLIFSERFNLPTPSYTQNGSAR